MRQVLVLRVFLHHAERDSVEIFLVDLDRVAVRQVILLPSHCVNCGSYSRCQFRHEAQAFAAEIAEMMSCNSFLIAAFSLDAVNKFNGVIRNF